MGKTLSQSCRKIAAALLSAFILASSVGIAVADMKTIVFSDPLDVLSRNDGSLLRFDVGIGSGA